MPPPRLLLLLLLLATPARGEEADCLVAIAAAEAAEALPPGLLRAMGRVESGRSGPRGVEPWPWALQAAGRGWLLESRADALARLAELQASGLRSIDVGCLQVNLLHHPAAFASAEEALSPLANARYAARFLRRLRDSSGDWWQAVARYHSADPARGEPYRQRVAAWLGGAPATVAPLPPRPSPAPIPPRALPRPQGPGQGGMVLWLRPPPQLPRLLRP